MRNPVLLLALLTLGVVGCDHATKGLAEHHLANRPPVPIVSGVVDLEYRQNRGVAFSAERFLPDGARGAIPVVAILAALGLGFLFWKQRHAIPPLPGALILGGAIGNLIDRVVRGYVVDFMHIHHWPVFNVADVTLVVGAILWMFSSYLRPLAHEDAH